MYKLPGTVRENKTRALFLLLGGLLLLFIVWPLTKTVVTNPPLAFRDTIEDGEVRSAVVLTFYASLIATVIALVSGVPLAYTLARTDFPGKRVIEGIIDVPIVVPHSAAGIALLTVFGRQAPVGKLFSVFGVRFVSATPGIVIAMLFVSLSFLVDAAKDGFEGVDPRLEKVARTLGASPWQTFWRISLPLAWRSILSGVILMWARGISEFGAVVILAYHPMIAPVLIYERFESFGLQYARPVAALMILIGLAAFTLLRMLPGQTNRRSR